MLFLGVEDEVYETMKIMEIIKNIIENLGEALENLAEGRTRFQMRMQKSRISETCVFHFGEYQRRSKS